MIFKFLNERQGKSNVIVLEIYRSTQTCDRGLRRFGSKENGSRFTAGLCGDNKISKV